jgi:ABC-type dipeptide/oligopeptide/nickel transport system permease component
MFRLIARRLLMSVPTLAGIVLVTFALTRLLPGDPAAYFAGNAASVEAVEQIRHKLGLDQPLATQFLRYVRELATGDWGQSLSTGQPVATEIATRLPASLELTLVALLASLSVSIPLGVAGRHPAWLLDRPAVPHRHHRRRVAADLLHRPAAVLRVLFPARLGAGAAGPARPVCSRRRPPSPAST